MGAGQSGISGTTRDGSSRLCAFAASVVTIDGRRERGARKLVNVDHGSAARMTAREEHVVVGSVGEILPVISSARPFV